MIDSKNLRLLAVSHNLNLEGAAISMFELMAGLAENTSLTPVIVALSNGPLREHYIERGLEVISLPCDEIWLRDKEKIHDAVKLLASFISSEDFDLLYANTILGYPAIHAAAYAQKPSVWNIRESQDEKFWSDFLGARYPMMSDAFNKAGSLIFVAEATRSLWNECRGISQSHLIYNALDMRSFAARCSNITRDNWREQNNIDSDSTVFLCVGTLHERKGQMDLLEAILRLSDVNSKPVAVCIGDSGGEYSKRLHNLREGLPSELKDRIRLLPKQFNIGDAYASADVFVCCSRNESYPRIILEALASKLPIVTTPVFGISEQVNFGVNALCYEPGDIDGLVNRLALLLSSPEIRNNYGYAAKKRFNEMATFNDMIKSYEQVFMSTLNRDL